ncbi:MAG: hypothetical protein JST33_02730 [Actinobacteria bacterium]|nr:hypothetical protein [Actinomycetota bacterium]
MTIPATSRRRMPAWLVILLIILIGGGAAAMGLMVGRVLGAQELRDVQVVRSVKGEEQVILVTTGITDIKEMKDNQSFFGLFDIPLSDRTTFLRYDYDAKYGIEGKDVRIRKLGDKSYEISIPTFKFLGYGPDPIFRVATESNGILSWTTPQIDTLKASKELLTEAAAAKHIDGVRPLLEIQAQKFYTRIVSSIEPDAKLSFDFALSQPSN